MTAGQHRVWCWSDIHAECPENAWDPAAHVPAAGLDVAVVAGDVHMPLTQALDWLGQRMRGAAVAYMPGNHDLWWDRGEDAEQLSAEMDRFLATVRAA